VTRRRRGHDESGSTLIIALFFTTIFSLFVVSVVTFTAAGLKASTAFVDQGKAAYGAAGATDAAIKRFSMGGPCDDYTAPPVNGHAMTVHCDDLRAPGGPLASQPAHALLGLGTSASEGVVSMSPDLQVQGSVFSKSTINTGTAGTMTVSGDVSAAGSCDRVFQPTLPASQAAYTKSCGSAADPALGTDPDFTPVTTTVPARQAVPSCPASGWLVTLTPGYYDDAAGLSRLTSGGAHGCPNGVVWLQPGIYYFDFTFHGGSDTWTISDHTVNVVGGTESGWSHLAAAGARPTLTVPGSCDNTSLDGVEIVLGGASHVLVDGGKAELCAPANPTGQRVALHGLSTPPANHVLKPTAVTTFHGFTNPDHALVAGEKATLPGCPPLPAPTTVGCTADAALGSATGMSASLTFAGFVPTVPAGSIIQSIKLVVTHEDDGDLTTPGAITVTAPFTGSTCGAKNLTQFDGAISPDIVDLKACGLTGPDQLNDLTVTLTATIDPGGTSATERVDGAVINVAYVAPTTFKPTIVTASSGFTNPANAVEIGEQPAPLTADAALNLASPSASLTVGGLADPPIAPGSSIVSAVLRVAHQERGNVAAPKVTVPFAGGTCTALVLAIQGGALADDRVDLKACGLTDASQLAGLSATYTASLATGGTVGSDSLDGMWLELVATPPPLTRPAITVASTTFVNPANAGVIDGTSATATLDATNPSGSIALSGYDHPTVPAGSALNTVDLRVTHRDSDNIAAVAVTLTGPAYSGPCTTGVPGLATHTSLLQEVLHLKSVCGLTDPAQLVGLTATYTAALDPAATSATDSLDGIVMDLTFAPPAVRNPSATASATAGFANPDNARQIGGGTADATLTAASPSASVAVSGYGTVPFPAGSVIDRAELRVVHQDDDTTPAPPPPPPPDPPPPPPPRNPPAPTVTVAFAGNTCAAAQPLTPHEGVLGVDVVDLKACGFTDPAALTNLSASYTAALAAGATDATDKLDGIELDVVLRAPTLEPLAGCLITTAYPAGSGTCALIKTTVGTSANPTAFAVQGTIYAPSAAIDISLSGVRSEVLPRGVIARTIRLGIGSAAGFTRPVVGVPPEPVLFTAYPDRPLTPTAATAFGGFPSDSNNALGIGEEPTPLTADATLNPSTPNGSVTLSGYQIGPTGTGPVDHAVLRIAHQDDGDIASVTVAAAFTGSTCDGTPLTLAVHPGALIEDQVDLTSLCSLSDLSQLAGLTLTYRVALASGGSSVADRLDGTQIDVLSGPALRASVAFDGRRATVEQWSVLR
jgi:hypothetical protein